MKRRQFVATLLQAAGAVALCVAAFGVSVLLGLVSVGIVLIVFGVVAEVGN